MSSGEQHQAVMESTTAAEPEPVKNVVLMSNKPLHRFVNREPQSLGIVVLVFGCAEILMGFLMAGERLENSDAIYIPYWQGALFATCGILSIYTAVHPSKKMVTVCLSMYVVSILGIIVSVCYRVFCLTTLAHDRFFHGPYKDEQWAHSRVSQMLCIEAILFISSLLVSGLLIFLCVIARLALKSTNPRILVRCTQAAQ